VLGVAKSPTKKGTTVTNKYQKNMGCVAGLETGKQFRCVNGHLHLPTLRAALQRHVAEQSVGTHRHGDRGAWDILSISGNAFN
jgi:hypothetical protein